MDSGAPAQAVRTAENVSGGITFAECFESYVSDKLAPQAESGRLKLKTIEQNWRQPFAKYLLPSLGGIAVAAITPIDCADVLRVAIAQAPSRASDVRSKLGRVLDFAKFHGHVPANPADGVEEVLSFGYDGGTNAAPTTGEAHSQFVRVLDSDVSEMIQLLFSFTLLTASRHSESREAAWSEIDFDAMTWTIPSTRYKTKREHRVALSAEAVRVLKRARQLAPDSELCLPSGHGRAYSKNWSHDMTHKLGANWTVHGFARKTFQDVLRLLPRDRRSRGPQAGSAWPQRGRERC